MTMTSALFVKVVQHMRGDVEWVPPDALFLALIDDEGNEADGGSYERKIIELEVAGPGAVEVENTNTIVFPDLPGFTLASLAIYDDIALGDALLTTPVDPLDVEVGDGLTWNPTQIKVALP